MHVKGQYHGDVWSHSSHVKGQYHGDMWSHASHVKGQYHGDVVWSHAWHVKGQYHGDVWFQTNEFLLLFKDALKAYLSMIILAAGVTLWENRAVHRWRSIPTADQQRSSSVLSWTRRLHIE